MIESFGIPHTEVDLIIVNGISVDFMYQVQNGDNVHVYPVFESFDISPLIRLRPQPLRSICFVLDCHLGKLAKYLRLFGFDSLYQNDYDDNTIVHLSNEEKRVILTKDRGLLKRNAVTHGYYVRNDNPEEQLREIFNRFDLYRMVDPFKRCLKCNGMLASISKEEVFDRLLENTKKYFNEFYICNHCDQIYWKGSHFEKMMEFIRKILKEKI